MKMRHENLYRKMMLIILMGVGAQACTKKDNSSLSKERLSQRAGITNNDPFTLVKSFDITSEVQWSADGSAEKFQGMALAIPVRSIDGSVVTMTMKLQQNTALADNIYDLKVTGDQKINSSINVVLPSLVADSFLLSEASGNLVKFTSAASGQSKYLSKANFATLPNGIVVSLSEWGTVALEKISADVAMVITSPAAGSFISDSNVANFAVAGTCAVDDSTISFSVSMNGKAAKTPLEATNSATCQKGQWSSKLNLSQFGDGTLTLYADNTVDTGQKSLQQSLALVKDTNSPSVTLTTTSNATTNVSPITMTATFSESVTGFTLADITTTNGTASDLSGSGSTYTFNVYPVVNGAVTATIAAGKASDAAGNTNTAGNTLSVTYSSSAPTVTLSSTATTSTATSPIPVSVSFSAAVTGFIASDITLSNGTLSNFAGSGTTYTFDVTPSGQGAVTVDVAAAVATDAAGSTNTAAAQLSRTYDTSGPTVAITSSVAGNPTNQTPIPVTVTFSESVTGFTVGDLTIGNGSASSFAGSGTTYTFNVTPSANGAVTVDIAGSAAQDGAGNNNTAATQFSKTYDGTAPTVSVSAPTASSYVNNSNKAALTVSGSCSENTRAVTVNITDGTTTVNPGSAVTCATGSSPNWTTTVDVTTLSDGALTVTAVQSDAAGNSTTSSGIVITKDAVNPAAVTTMGWSGSSPTTATSLTAAWTVSTAADLASQAIQFYTGSSCNTASGSLTAIASNVTATAAYTAAAEGNFSYKITSYDTAGNSSVSACSSAITVATTAVTANSTITGTGPTTADGTSASTVTITLKNTNNDAVVGVTPTFSATNTGTTNSYGTCSATNSSGVSTCTLTSTKAESKTLSIATPISKADGSVTFQNGAAASVAFTTQPPDGYRSTALSPQPIVKILDANSNIVTTGVDATATVTLTLQSGTGSLGGTASMAAVSGVADFSGKGLNVSATGSKTLRATKSSTTGSGGVAALTVDSNSFAITDAVPVLTSVSSQNFPSSYLNQGSTFSQDFNNTNTGDDTGMTYACTYDQVVDGAVASGTACTSLPGTATLNTSTGALSWTASNAAFGPYELKVTGANGAGTGSRIFVIDVRPAYVTTNLLGAWDAQFADLTQPVSGNTTTWKDLTTNGYDGTLNSTSNASWAGSGTYGSPYALSFNGSGLVDFGSTVGNASTKMMFSSWVNPSNASSSADAVILGSSGNATGNGFTVRQKPSYRDVVMSLNPVGYWRLGETSGTTAVDLGSGGNNGTYTNGPTLAQAGGLTSDENNAVSFDGSNDYVVSAANTGVSGDFTASISAWVKFNDVNSGWHSLASIQSSSDPGQGFAIFQGQPGAGALVVGFYGSKYGSTAIGTVTTGQWYHIVITKAAGAIGGSTSKLYLNGVLQTLTFNSSSTPNIPNDAKFYIGSDASSEISNSATIDDVSYFNTALTAAQVTSLYQAGTTGKKMDFVLGKSYQDVVMAKNPIAYWRLGESSGTVAADISGYGNNASYKNAPTMGSSGAMTADSDKAVTLNGSSQYVAIPAFTNPTTLSDYTVSIWFNLTAHNAAGRSYLLDLRGDGSASASSLGVIIDNNGGTELHCFAHYTDNNYTEYKFPLTSYTLGTWGHVICSRSGSQMSAYFNGAPVTTSGLQSGSIASRSEVHSLANKARIGTYSAAAATGNYWFSGKIDEVTIYSSSLTSAEVATMYNAGIGTYGATCTSTSGFASSTWNFISGLIDGSSASFFVNGRQECTVNSVPQTLSSASTNLTVGSTASGTKGWVGYLADLLLYGTSDGSAVATAANIKTNFDATADRYRQNPVGNIVKEGLVLNLDAANAKQGLRPFANGCASTDLSWFDLSSSALTGTLTNFASCGASSGWNGDGTSSNPYRLTFDGSSDVVNFGDVELVTGNTLSICTWIKSSSIAQYSGIVAKTYDVWQYHFGGDYNPGTNKIQFNVASIGCVAKSNSALNDNAWHHVCGVYDGSLASANIKLYVDGTVQTATANCTGNVPNTVEALKIGAQGSTTATNYFFAGSIGQASIYNTALTSSQISQNCNALKSRFSGANCN